MAQDIFVEINNAVLDLQASQYQTYERPLKRLWQLLSHPDLASYNAQLTQGLNLDAFIKKSNESSGSMVGSAKLAWPDDRQKEMGLIILLIQWLADNPSKAIDFGFNFFYSGKNMMSGVHAMTRQIIIPFARDYKAYVQSKGTGEVALKSTISKRIFIVHGHDDGAREAVARFLERLGFEPIILHEQANQGRTVIEKVVAHGDVGFSIVLLTPDDEGRAKGGGDLESRARQNVLLELGFFIGKLGRDRVCTIKRGEVEIPSDFLGVVWHLMDSSDGWKQGLARELQAAGYTIDWNAVMGSPRISG